MVIISYTQEFRKQAKRQAKTYRSLADDLEAFVNELSQNPNMCKDLGSGVRKIRMAVKSKGKGTSGGMRVITFNVIIDRTDTEITLLSMYDKSEKESISDKEIKVLLESIEQRQYPI